MLMHSTRGEGGVGVLLIFIVTLIGVAAAIGVLYSSSEDAQQDMLTDAKGMRNSLVAGLNILQVMGSNGALGELQNVSFILGLGPNSGTIDLKDVTVLLNTEHGSTTLAYRGADGIVDLGSDGFDTLNAMDLSEQRVNQIEYGTVDSKFLSLPISINPDGTFDPAPTFGNVYVYNSLSNQQKPRLVSDSTDRLLAVWEDYSGNPDIFASFSADYGNNWSAPVAVDNTAFAQYTPDIAVSDDDVFYVVWMESNAVRISNSTDGGVSWSIPAQVNTAGTGTDPAIAIRSDGRIFVVWDAGNEVYMSYSDNGGGTWQPRILIDDGGQLQNYPDIDVDSEGDVVAVWEERISPANYDAMVSNSSDGGNTWSPSVTIHDASLTHQFNPEISIAGTRIQAAWVDYRGGNQDIYSAYSDDDGRTWSNNQTVHTVTVGNQRDMSISTRGDMTAILFEGGVGTYNIFMAISYDGGDTWLKDLKVDTTSGVLCNNPWVYIGEDGNVNMIWYDNRYARNDVWFDKFGGDFFLINSTHANFYSKDGQMYAVDLEADLSSVPKSVSIEKPIGPYGYLTVEGTTNTANTIEPQMTFNVRDAGTPIEDIDLDGQGDLLYLNTTHLTFVISSDASPTEVALGTKTTFPPSDISVSQNIGSYASLEISGTTTGFYSLEGTTAILTPKAMGSGFFVAEPYGVGDDYMPGHLNKGDIVKVHLEAAEPLAKGEKGTIKVIPKSGMPAVVSFTVPTLLYEEDTVLYMS